ncbi:MAG: AAA family ATPase [Clostridiales bacterium]|jgi:RecA-family ATPase|nr:AAA family ATPase [Clostridiales bacterium]
MAEKKEKTVLNPSVGADGGQPILCTDQSISEAAAKNKTSYEEMLRKLNRVTDPAYLPTISMSELYENVYQSRTPVIDGLLYPGTYLFAGSPKVGKSFFMAQLAYHVSTGTPLWDFPAHQGTVLYLALEDDHRRLQKRLYRMFGAEGTDNLYFAVFAKQLGDGLEEQLKKFLEEHLDTRLVIIDTLQKIRGEGGEKYSYSTDYEVISRLKKIADDSGICLLLVHHTRKQQADDKFDMISGTNGLLGSADGAFLLYKENRTSTAAILDVSGRDQQDQRLYLNRDKERLTWELEEVETEIWVEPPDPVLEAVAKVVSEESPEWQGTASGLIALTNLDMKPNTLTLRLNVNAGRFMSEYHIAYESSRTHAARRVKLALQPAVA